MKIGFRTTNAPGLLPGLFNDYTKWSLKTEFPHGGIVIGDELWHTTKKGFAKEPFVEFSSWQTFDTDVSDELGVQRLTPYLGMRYDIASLLGFKIPVHISDANALYCFEPMWIGLTGENPSTLITPEKILTYVLRKHREQPYKARAFADNGDDRHGDNIDTNCYGVRAVAAEFDIQRIVISPVPVNDDRSLGN
jgi:hypothetical protein